ncbi:MAG: hypothetical protein PUB80_06385, partial [Clostridiales bacterium]|nr:hypothetical protein [Clostridiales bacterium]
MKRHMRALALCLCLLLMLPVFSGAAAQAEDSGLVLSKSSEYDAASQTVRLTLEAYTTGQIVTERVSTPCDVALVRARFLNPAGWQCSMIWSAYMGLPLSLEGVGAVLKLDSQKMKEGKDLIRYFCTPCKPTKTNGGRT